MHILYLDDAGSVANASERFFVLAGVALFERQTFFLEQALDRVAAGFRAVDPKHLELHGNAMLAGRGFWRSVPRDARRQGIGDALRALTTLQGTSRLFAAAARFDRFLLRRHREGDTQRGLIVLDKSTMETRLQALATEFRFVGHRAGRLTNLADVPFFVDSRASRLIQYADLVSYALWRKYERDDPEFFDIIADRFDQEGGVIHGLCVRQT
jgi:hypothetical protein